MQHEAANWAERALGQGAKVEARRIAGKAVAKRLAKSGSTVVAKTVARTASSPWLLVADGAELVVDKTARGLGADEKTAKVASKGTGAAASVGIGAAVGGPVGALVGLGAWGLGELVGLIFE